MRKTTKRNIASRNILIYFLSFAKQFKTYVFVFFSSVAKRSKLDNNNDLFCTVSCFATFNNNGTVNPTVHLLLQIYNFTSNLSQYIVKFHWTFLSLSSSKENYYLIHTHNHDVSIGWNQKIRLQRAYCRWEWDYVFC